MASSLALRAGDDCALLLARDALLEATEEAATDDAAADDMADDPADDKEELAMTSAEDADDVTADEDMPAWITVTSVTRKVLSAVSDARMDPRASTVAPRYMSRFKLRSVDTSATWRPLASVRTCVDSVLGLADAETTPV